LKKGSRKGGRNHKYSHGDPKKKSIEDGNSESTFSSNGNGSSCGEKIPEILFVTTGHGKNSLIKTAAGGAAIAAAVTKMMKQQGMGAHQIPTIFEEEATPPATINATDEANMEMKEEGERQRRY